MKKIFHKKSIRRSVLLVVLSSILANVLILVIYFLFFQYSPTLRTQLLYPIPMPISWFGRGGAEGAIEEKDAQEIIADYFLNSGEVKVIYREREFRLHEITNNRLWNNNEMQLFIIDSKLLAIFKSGELIKLLSGEEVDQYTGIQAVYISDLNGNNQYDICIHMSRGSGIVSGFIIVCDTSTYTTYIIENDATVISSPSFPYFRSSESYRPYMPYFSNSINIYFVEANTEDGWDRKNLGKLRIVDEALVIE